MTPAIDDTFPRIILIFERGTASKDKTPTKVKTVTPLKTGRINETHTKVKNSIVSYLAPNSEQNILWVKFGKNSSPSNYFDFYTKFVNYLLTSQMVRHAK